MRVVKLCGNSRFKAKIRQVQYAIPVPLHILCLDHLRIQNSHVLKDLINHQSVSNFGSPELSLTSQSFQLFSCTYWRRFILKSFEIVTLANNSHKQFQLSMLI